MHDIIYKFRHHRSHALCYLPPLVVIVDRPIEILEELVGVVTVVGFGSDDNIETVYDAV